MSYPNNNNNNNGNNAYNGYYHTQQQQQQSQRPRGSEQDPYLTQPTNYNGHSNYGSPQRAHPPSFQYGNNRQQQQQASPLPPVPPSSNQYPVPTINVSGYAQQQQQQQAVPIPSPTRAGPYNTNSPGTSPTRQQPLRPLPNTYRSASYANDPFAGGDSVYNPIPGQTAQQQQEEQHSGVYNSPRRSGYGAAPASVAASPQPAPQPPVQDSEYYTNRDHEQEYFSTLQNSGVNRSNSTLRFAGYPETDYAPSVNDIEEDPYNNAYAMNDMSGLSAGGIGGRANLSNTNVPFMQQQQAQAPQQQQGFYSNLFEPYAMDQDDPIENDFTPFPVTGDAYEINAYGVNGSGDEPSFEETSISEEESYNAKEEGSSVIADYYETPRFGDPEDLEAPPPDGEMPRRSKSTKGIKVKMIDGNLILDCEVSQQLLSKYPNPVTAQDREFRYMRYQAATCDPADFSSSKFSLRQLCYFQPRQTELMIVVTMFNEDDILLARTLQGVFKNIKYLTSKTNSSTWGKDAWKKVVVCIVSDGRTKINPRSQALLAALGVYQEGFAKNVVNEKPVVGHIYEYTTMVDISKIKDNTIKLTTQKTVPVQLLFCLKEKNQKKINSHRWCFQAFAPILNPNVVVLLDAGTQPAGDSIYHLWKAFDKNQNVAGACGEIRAMLNPVWYKTAYEMVRKPIVYAQNFEYKTSNILDKPMESVFGFVTVLPGAFSAYRYVALQNDVNGVGPLASYFKGETLHNTDSGLFTANMYLAEDRILCYELVAKQGCNWVLKYVKSANAKTDVPDQLPEFILQRRRWLNGSFFAAIYSLVHFYKIWKSSHSMIRKFFFHIQFFYQLISLLVSWFSLGSYFLVFRILTVNLGDESLNMAKVGNVLSVLFLWLYLACIVTTFVLSFGNKPKGTKRFYVVIVCFFAVLMAYMIFAAIYMSIYAVRSIIEDNGGNFTFSLMFKSSRFRDLVVATVSTYALYFIGAFIFLDPWHMFTSFIQYILLSPAYINVLNIYAFCNIHDISWGTKGDTGVKLDLGVARQSSTEGKFFIEIPTTNQEVDDAYTRQINVLLNPEAETKHEPDPEEAEKDYYAFVRSMTVLFWMVSNFVIIALVLETGGVNQLGTVTTDATGYLSTNSEVFLTVILWIVAFMALFRFLGCVAYTILRLVGK